MVPGKNSWSLSLELEALVIGSTYVDPQSLPRFHRWQGRGTLKSYARIRIPQGEDSITDRLGMADHQVKQLKVQEQGKASPETKGPNQDNYFRISV